MTKLVENNPHGTANIADDRVLGTVNFKTMKIEHKQIKIGSRVRLLEDVEMFNCTYTKGHEFNVIGSSYRGWDLKDDDGNEMGECLFIHDKLELVQ